MINNSNKVIVVVPHRISGFFEIVDKINGENIDNPEQIGSTGAGFNLSAVGKTSIIYQERDKDEMSICKISINNEELNEKAETSHYIFNFLKDYFKFPVEVEIEHQFDLPVGCGYGASGVGALGTVIGLNKLFNLELSNLEIGRIAHVSEVVNRTGLGTVCGLLRGGLCILQKSGYPCVSEKVTIPKDINVLCGSFGMIPTKSILSDPILSPKIKEAGRIALKKLNLDPNILTFMDASIEFVNNTNILDILELDRMKELIESLNRLDIIGASMNQLGRSVYTICKKKNKKDVIDTFESYKPEIKIFDLFINQKGPLI